MSVVHGGDLQAASAHYGRSPDQWLDLSTGINPDAYPVPALSAECFSRLPYSQPDFERAVAHYYLAESSAEIRWQTLAGSQQLIQQLPELLPAGPMLAPNIGYREYVDHWQRAGRETLLYASLGDQQHAVADIDRQLAALAGRCHLLLINPNNPSGLLFEDEQILRWARQLAPGFVLIVDEAFIDLCPQHSLLHNQLPENLLLLRSFGKFFGLAGLRLGFVFGHRNSHLLTAIEQRLGLWACNGPAQLIAQRALMDEDWQRSSRLAIAERSRRSQQLFQPLLATAQLQAASGLFNSYLMSAADAAFIYDFFAQYGILLRLIAVDESCSLLRIGLSVAVAEPRIGDVVEACREQFEQHCQHATELL